MSTAAVATKATNPEVSPRVAPGGIRACGLTVTFWEIETMTMFWVAFLIGVVLIVLADALV